MVAHQAQWLDLADTLLKEQVVFCMQIITDDNSNTLTWFEAFMDLVIGVIDLTSSTTLCD